MSDSFSFDFTDDEGIKEIMALAFRKHRKGAAGWSEVDGSLVFYWGVFNEKSIIPFPVPVTSDAAAEIALSWLENQDYGRGPDTDGSAKKGFRVYNEAWGHAGGSYLGFAAIKPAWIVYGK